MNARRLLATASGVVALLALTGCEKPAPIVTVVSGGQSVHTEASSWCFEGQTPPDCAERAKGITELSVRGGQTVGVDVDEELAGRGWYIELAEPEGQAAEGQGTQPQRSEPQRGHYFTFTAPNLPAGSALLLDVLALGEGDEPTGQWRFRLTPER